MVQHLAGSSWGANAKVLRTSALSLVYSSAEYCAPMWLNSAHVRNVDVQLNRVMRTISGTLMPTPLPWLPVLCNIAPTEIRRKEALVREFNKIVSAPELPIFQDLQQGGNRLKSRKPPLQLATHLVENNFSPRSSWARDWEVFLGRNHNLVSDPSAVLRGMNLPRKEWTLLNRFRTDVGRSNYWKFKWGHVTDQSCDCGAELQTMNHVLNDCPLRAFSGGLEGLHMAGEAALEWLRELDLAL